MSTPETSSLLLYEASKLLGAPLHLKNGLDSLLTGAFHHYGFSTCILLVENNDGFLRAEYALGVSQTFTQSVRIAKGEGAIGVAYASALARVIASGEELEDKEVLKSLFERQRLKSAILLPLKAEGRVIGTALFGSQQAKRLPEDRIQELSTLTERLALALYNNKKVADLEAFNKGLQAQVASTVQELSRTNTHLVQKVRELKSIYELAMATTAATTVDEVVRLMTSCVKDLVGVQGAAFFFLRGSIDTLEPVLPAFDLDPVVAQGLACKVEGSPWLAELMVTKQPQILNLLDSSESLPAAWRELGVRSLLALPLLREGSVQGMFCAINKLNGLFHQDDVRLVSLLIGRVTDMMQRISLDEELRKRVYDLSILQEMGAQLPSPPVLSDTVGALGRVIRRALSADLCFFFVHHIENETLVMMGGDWDSSLSFDPQALTLGVSEKVPLATAFNEQEQFFYERASATTAWEKDDLVRALKLGQALYLPLKVEQRCVGILALGLFPPRSFSQEKKRQAVLLANQAAIPIERSILYDRLKAANEKLEHINRLKNEFITMVSHELRTPLTTIKGFSSIVLNEETGPLNSQQRHFLETSDKAINRLTLLVSDLLDISRIEAGQIKMQLRPIHLQDVCERLAISFAPQVKAQNLTLALHLPKDLPRVLADPDRLTQVLDNLLANALKFTVQGGITISALDKGDYVMVSMKDTGSGIAKEEQERIFDKFYQVKVGSGYPHKGTGLGLAIVKSIIESHRGKVWVDSERGKGSEFRFILPRARPEIAVENKP